MKRFNDFLSSARGRLPHFLFEYINGGAFDESTMEANLSRLAATTLRQRVLKDVSQVSTESCFFGETRSLPIVLGPVGFAGMMARRGEVQTARAAARLGIPYCMSTFSVCSMAEVASAVKTPFWFQLNMFKDRGLMTELLQEAARVCSVLVFSVDLPVGGIRYRDFRSGMTNSSFFGGTVKRWLQAAARPHWSWNVGVRGRPHALGNIRPYIDAHSKNEDSHNWVMRNFDPAATWRELSWIRSSWRGPLVIKGLLDPEDAQAAMDIGANGIVVSNHGGRQLDSAIATVDALPLIAERVRGRGTLFVDGGVRSGIDVLKMISLGADGVFLGRAWINALAANGEDGVVELLNNMGRELRDAMTMTGCRSLNEPANAPSELPTVRPINPVRASL